MTLHVASTLSDGTEIPVPIGMPTLVKMAFDGMDLAPVWNSLVERVKDNPNDAAALIDLSTIALVQGRPKDRIALQAMALELKRVFRQPSKTSEAAPLKVLAFMSSGTFMDNMPVEFLLEQANVNLDMVYLDSGTLLPRAIPDHDVALVCIGQSRENQKLLGELSITLASWPKPVVNRPECVAQLTRKGTWELLRTCPDIVTPMHAEITRAGLQQIADRQVAVSEFLNGQRFPIIARPVDSHAGEGLVKLEAEPDIAKYLQEQREDDFCIAPFVDYRSKDGLFRKYRVALIQRRAYAVHMAISQHWMIHYLNADMRGRPERRDEEAQWMRSFDGDFATRHAQAFRALGLLTGLEYLPFDCGETSDGKLLLFETGTNMIIHAMDPEDLFAYKRPQMEIVFDAFREMLSDAAFEPMANTA